MKYKCLVQFLGKCSVNVKSCPHEIQSCFLFFFFLKILLLLDRGKGREERGKETSMCGCPIEDLAHNPGMCPDWELNQRPFGLQACTQSTEPHQPGVTFGILIMMCLGLVLFVSILFGTLYFQDLYVYLLRQIRGGFLSLFFQFGN